MPPPSGKWIWIWQLPQCDGGDFTAIGRRLKEAGCAGVIYKTNEGPAWRTSRFDQGIDVAAAIEALKAQGLGVLGWGYNYPDWDLEGQAGRAGDVRTYGADGYVFDMEGEWVGRPGEVARLLGQAREMVGPGFPLFVSTFALVGYHRDFPFASCLPHVHGWLPQVYFNVFPRRSYRGLNIHYAAGALPASFADYQEYGLLPPGTVYAPAIGVYDPYPSGDNVGWFIEESQRRGFPWVSFWSYQHMDEAMWQAVAGAAWATATPSKPLPTSPEEKEGLTMGQYEELSARIAALESRVGGLESRLGQSAATPPQPPPPPKERYHIVGPEGRRGLWGVAEHLGLPTAQIPAWIKQVKALNGFTAENPVIREGDRLRIL